MACLVISPRYQRRQNLSHVGRSYFIILDCPVSWNTEKQTFMARSSAEAENRFMASTTAKLLWLRSLLSSLGRVTDGAPPAPICRDLCNKGLEGPCWPPHLLTNGMYARSYATRLGSVHLRGDERRTHVRRSRYYLFTTRRSRADESFGSRGMGYT
ncbi:hypothetical protein CRG98_001017 [Punica granatum]|uniref:Uncharacterized protein n=1 Tax=Punica granatum TaxID=22663 RepID=A0A2I0LD91_PUNGR|nr:hypothetical protein CRG98_001017 [Punica granatum]